MNDLFSNINFTENFDSKNTKTFNSIELFAGAGGLALGLEKAGFNAKLLNEIDKNACATLRHNRPNWPLLNEDIRQVDFSAYKGEIDLLAGGFPCQAFSYAGKGKGFEDARGTLFFEFARAIDEVQPKVILGENVRGLLAHDQGRTLATIKQIIDNLGYQLVPPVVFKAINYKVPQKRERLFLVAIRKDIAHQGFFNWPKPSNQILTLRDALKKGLLYDNDVPFSEGQIYAPQKKAVLDLVPQGGCWRDLPDAIQREYIKSNRTLPP